MKKHLSAVLVILAVIILSSCGKAWLGFDDEDLSKYVTLAEFTPIERLIYEPTEDEISASFTEAVNEHLVPVITDGAYGGNMIAKCVIYVFVNGESDPEMTLNDYEITMGNFLSDYITGKKSGDTAEAKAISKSLLFPLSDDGEKIDLKINIISVKKYEIPEFDEKFCSTVRPGCRTESELKERIAGEIKKAKEEEHNLDAFYKNWSDYCAGCTFSELPYELYIGYFNGMKYAYEALAESAGVSYRDYVEKYCDTTVEELEKTMIDKAISKAKTSLIVFATAKKAGITVTESDLFSYAEKIAESSEGEFESADEVILYYGEDELKEEYLMTLITEHYTKE
ncbi:MAG: hypothetical protein KBT31_02710 [Firmicutes bacterium]|nr:hypothetical protein [Candidatus Colimorpha enterica]